VADSLLFGHVERDPCGTVSDTAPAPQHPEVHPEPNFDSVHRFSAWLERSGKAEATVDAYHTDVADLVRAYAPRPVEELISLLNETIEAERQQKPPPTPGGGT